MYLKKQDITQSMVLGGIKTTQSVELQPSLKTEGPIFCQSAQNKQAICFYPSISTECTKVLIKRDDGDQYDHVSPGLEEHKRSVLQLTTRFCENDTVVVSLRVVITPFHHAQSTVHGCSGCSRPAHYNRVCMIIGDHKIEISLHSFQKKLGLAPNISKQHLSIDNTAYPAMNLNLFADRKSEFASSLVKPAPVDLQVWQLQSFQMTKENVQQFMVGSEQPFNHIQWFLKVQPQRTTSLQVWSTIEFLTVTIFHAGAQTSLKWSEKARLKV